MSTEQRKFLEKVYKVEEQLWRQGVQRSAVSPPLYRFLWSMGLKLKPPLFQSFLSRFLHSTILFAVGVGTIALVFLCLGLWFGVVPSSPSHLAVWSLILGGALAVGLLDAWVIRKRAHKLGLPRWEDVENSGLMQRGSENELVSGNE